MKRHGEAYQYLRLTWTPKLGERVYFEGRKCRIEKVSPVDGVKLYGRTGWLYPGQVLWRPTPKDFNAVLSKLQDLWVYRQLLADNRQVVGITVNGRTMPIRGRAPQILSTVLAMRVVDSKISITINNLFEKAYTKERNVPKLHAIQKKSSPP